MECDTFNSGPWQHWYPDRYGIFATTSFGGFNLATMLVSGSLVTHVGEFWRLRCKHNRLVTCLVYAEMQFDANGLVGPRPMRRLLEWERARPWRRVRKLWLPLPMYAPRAKWRQAAEMQERRLGYAKNQLLAIFGRRWLRWEHIPVDDSHMTCCEHVTLQARPELELTDCEHPTPDATTPGSVWRQATRKVAAENRMESNHGRFDG